MKITKNIQAFEAGNFSQNWEISVDADRHGLNEVLDIIAVNYHNDKEVSRVSILSTLNATNSVDLIIDQYDWSLEYAEHVAGEKEYNELNWD